MSGKWVVLLICQKLIGMRREPEVDEAIKNLCHDEIDKGRFSKSPMVIRCITLSEVPNCHFLPLEKLLLIYCRYTLPL